MAGKLNFLVITLFAMWFVLIVNAEGTNESTWDIQENLAAEPSNNTNLESAISKLSNLNQSKTTNESIVNDTNNNELETIATEINDTSNDSNIINDTNTSDLNNTNTDSNELLINESDLNNNTIIENITNEVSENITLDDNNETVYESIINDTETPDNTIETSSETLAINNEITTDVVEEDNQQSGQDVTRSFGVSLTIVA